MALTRRRFLAAGGAALATPAVLQPSSGRQMFRAAGLNVDDQAMDWGTVQQRRQKQDPIAQGGWSMFCTNGLNGTDMLDIPTYGKTPPVSNATLQNWGYRVAIYPGIAFSAAAAAMRIAYTHLLEHGTMQGLPIALYHETGHGSLHDLMGFAEVHEFEKRWAQ